jgi:hypothetical protein
MENRDKSELVAVLEKKRYEIGIYIGFKPNYLINRCQIEIYISLISIYYRHRCQTGEKAIYEYKVGYKMVISLFLPICRYKMVIL